MKQNVRQIRVTDEGWTAEIVLGDNYWVEAECKNGELGFLTGKGSIRNEPISWDTILEQVEEMIEGIEIPDVETNRFGGIEED